MSAGGIPISRRSLAGLGGALLGMPLVGAVAADLWSALRSPDHLAVIRHASAPGNLDPPNFKLADCTTQRNLSDHGRDQARRMGDLMRANAIAAARLYSSQWCRCLDTARLMRLGEVTPQPLLNYFGPEPEPRERQLDALRAWIGKLDLVQPTLLVTHQVVISGLIDAAAGNGEIFVVRREPAGRIRLQGRQSTG